MSMWFAGASFVVGTGLNLYGANKQSKDNAHAQDLNLQAQANQNNSAWTNWLMSRGIAPNSPVQAGVTPGPGQYTAVNTRLPFWATVNAPAAPGGTTTWRKRGTAPGALIT